MNLTPILTNSKLCPTQAAADARAYREVPAAAPGDRDRLVQPDACRSVQALQPHASSSGSGGVGSQVEHPVPPEAPDSN